MNIILGIIVGLVVLTTLVVLHEFGHFIMARKNGVRVKEFGIGFPPRAIAWIKGSDGKWHRFYKKDWQEPQENLIISINWLPIGGFCSMDGESDADTRKGTFGAASFWSKTKILFGGVIMNWLTAAVIFTVLAITGMPQFIENQFSIPADTYRELYPVAVSEVMEDSPAENAGLKNSDLIAAASYIDADGITETQSVTSTHDLISFNDRHAGQTVTYTIYSADCTISDCISTEPLPANVPDGYIKHQIEIQLAPKDAKYILGVAMHSTGQSVTHSTWSAPIVGIITTAQITGETFRGMGQMVANLFSGIINQFSSDETTRNEASAALQSAGDSVTGPVGILGTLFPSFIDAGPSNLAFLAAIISISLACMNVLPIPALDGGRWLLIAIYKLRKKPLDTETEGRIVSRAFLFLIALAILITVLDVIRIAS